MTRDVTGTTDDRRWLRRLGWASLVANIVLVITGGAVRLTGSGLGCPTWPHCNGGSFTPHGATTIHSAIEFSNRTLTFALSAVAIATLVATILHWRRTHDGALLWMSIALFGFIPLQAVIGGITVLTDLNPWVVSLHLLSSMGIIGLAVVFIWRIDRPLPRPKLLGWLTFATAWVVLYAGTIVTGAGPHAGDEHARRNGLSPLETSQFHADAVFLLVGLTIAMLVLRRSRAVLWLFLIEVGQGVIGYVQYFTHLPIGLVAVHMLGAALVSAAATWVLLDSGPHGGPDNGAVDDYSADDVTVPTA